MVPNEATRSHRKLSIRSQLVQSLWAEEPERQRAMLLLDVARQYYEYGMGQAEIAQATGYSRPTVGRMLAEAREVGIVNIQIMHPLERSVSLEQTIRLRYGIQHVRVAPRSAVSDGIVEVGKSCASLLESVLQPGMSLGLSNGRIHNQMVSELHHMKGRGVTVVQMVGGLSRSTRLLDGDELCRRAAEALGGTSHSLRAPLLARDANAAQALAASPDVARTLELAEGVDVAVIGIGAGFRHPASVFSGTLTGDTVRTLHKHGAVGHILGRFVDSSGRPVATNLDRRVIGTTLESLRNIPFVVAVAAGTEKAPAIAAALRAGLIDVLLVDVTAAQELAHLPESPTRTPQR
ncbi:sugar-binding transcriptional regulator [Paramicrobacterium fandaimingii]|uniref:sugar-binding transcriptional regulator n=1 Tax=Paramicrobacterium fandaimingii TaxID=2708079 RepID=UPI001423FD73|nr:sugar-binding domain-containing protein [Microbacterium fandaimingii]